ncbi:MAG: hypothetical protein JSW56_02580 [Deltaproteobacteria bacterium]|nr:MAG: hypothetical protein JSW56_02580 [Deltaproteobacteria bacterium]
MLATTTIQDQRRLFKCQRGGAIAGGDYQRTDDPSASSGLADDRSEEADTRGQKTLRQAQGKQKTEARKKC